MTLDEIVKASALARELRWHKKRHERAIQDLNAATERALKCGDLLVETRAKLSALVGREVAVDEVGDLFLAEDSND